MDSIKLTTQNDFNVFYDKMRQYAERKASRIFYDTALREQSVDKAMDKVVDHFVNKREMNEAFIRSVIKFSLRDSQKLCKVTPVTLSGTGYEEWGWRGRKLREK